MTNYNNGYTPEPRDKNRIWKIVAAIAAGLLLLWLIFGVLDLFSNDADEVNDAHMGAQTEQVETVTTARPVEQETSTTYEVEEETTRVVTEEDTDTVTVTEEEPVEGAAAVVEEGATIEEVEAELEGEAAVEQE